MSFDGPEGSAQKVAALCADLGVKLTPAGATWPYGKDPRDTNIRIAPSYPTVEDLEAALDVLVLAVKLVAAELARASAPNARLPVLSALSIRKGAYTWIWVFPPTPRQSSTPLR